MSQERVGWAAIRGFVVLVYVFMFAPILIVVVLAFNSAQFGGFPIEGFSFRWFEELYNNAAIVRAFQTSLVLGLLTAAVATTMGVLASLAIVRYEFPGKTWINTLLVAPVLIPETVLAVGLLLFMRWLSQPRSFVVLLLGHVLVSLPYVVLVVQARLYGVKRVYEEAALSLGANRFQTFMAVTLPLLMPAVFAGLLFSFTISFDNITATIFWRPPGVETVPTQIFGMLRTSISPEINALGTVMILITVGLPLAGGAIARYVLRARA
jgi:spermidine/putrescine transport system permease protein